jgi:hypothetical protein
MPFTSPIWKGFALPYLQSSAVEIFDTGAWKRDSENRWAVSLCFMCTWLVTRCLMLTSGRTKTFYFPQGIGLKIVLDVFQWDTIGFHARQFCILYDYSEYYTNIVTLVLKHYMPVEPLSESLWHHHLTHFQMGWSCMN